MPTLAVGRTAANAVQMRSILDSVPQLFWLLFGASRLVPINECSLLYPSAHQQHHPHPVPLTLNMSYKPLFPPLDGSVPPIPGFVDFQQKHNGDRPWILFPSGATVSSISFSQFADATHRVAHAFAPNMTRSNGEVVALIINCDTVLYVAMLAGLIRAGFVVRVYVTRAVEAGGSCACTHTQPFPMSPRNTVAAFVNMMEKTSCRRVISQSAFSPVVNEIKAQLEDNGTHILVHDLPRLHDIFPQLSDSAVQPVDPFPPAGKPHCMDDIVLYLHSSGSTGLPKPIPQRQETSVQWCSIRK